ncbi:isochorismatase family protein [Aquimarina sp. U1-2]|nr:isochorismatase family protein [Aquimarina sp. U1-2]
MKPHFTIKDTAIVLIDHQQGTVKLAKNMDEEVIKQNTKALARTAIETGMPLVLTTSNETQFQGPLFEFLEDIASKAHENRIKRPGMVNAWEYIPFKEAVASTGKKNIIMAGLTNDVCTVYPAINAVADGYSVQVVVDAGGSPTQLADDIAQRRMENEGVVLTSTNQVMAELGKDWSTENGGKILNIMYEEILGTLMNS